MAKPFGIDADRGTLSPGCPEMSEAPEKQAQGRGWWPSVETEVEAKGAAHQGAGAAVFVASVTALFSVLATGCPRLKTESLLLASTPTALYMC